MIILSIETSCDETAAAIVKFSKNKAEVLANVVSSQIKTHSKFGGVVPSLASRMHLKNMVPVLERAFRQAEKKLDTRCQGHRVSGLINYIAVTNGPGLIPALMIGTQAAKTLAYALNKPLVPIHHIEGHIYANWIKKKLEIGNWKLEDSEKLSLRGSAEPKQSRYYARGTDVCEIPAILTSGLLRRSAPRNDICSYNLWNPEFPVLCLIVSGGHTQLILMKKDLDYKIIGETLDDAAGEAFDKVAKLLGAGYPGGPVIEKMARLGDRNKFKFPRPMMNSKDFNFSFSGLKTAVMYKWNVESGIPDASRGHVLNLEDKKEKTKFQNSGADFNSAKLHPDFRQDSKFQTLPAGRQGQNSKFKSDIAASFQQAVIDVLIYKTIKAAQKYKVKNIILGGGVSANKELRKQLDQAIKKEFPISNFQFPISDLSTDNALMIAVAGYYHILNNKNISDWKNVEADASLVLSI